MTRPANPDHAVLEIGSTMAPPHWALLERELLKAEAQACEAFYEHYFDERGYLLCVPRWGGDDGADDAAENLLNWTMLHALGAPDVVLDLFKRGWEGHLRQYTEAKTEYVPFAREGMYFKEFPVMFDWMHNGEGFSAFFLQGLSDPQDPAFALRTRRYAGLYMGDDPAAPNYDPEHRIIRSMFNGSRGPLMRKATGLDWAGDPIEIEGRFDPGHGERNFKEMIIHFQDYNDVVGDHPLNMGTTTLAFNAYALTGEQRYLDWLVGYVDAWVERTEANGGITPSNVGLDGTIGGACGGRWYGGVYGWGFSVYNPATGKIQHRPAMMGRAPWSFGNGLLTTGDFRYVDTWRGVIDAVNANAKEEGGRKKYPRMHGDEGWYDFRDEPFDDGAMEVYYWTLDPSDRERVDNGWLDFLEGRNPGYPVAALESTLEEVRMRMEGVRQDTASPDTRMSDDMNGLTPALTDSLTELMLGGLPPGRQGHPLHARVRYFDPERRRAGVPEDVAALVTGMTTTETALTLVNLNQVEARTVIVQGGGYGEHRIDTASSNGKTVDVDGRSFAVHLEPGAGAEVTLTMRRYANKPTLSFPWAG